MISIQMRCISPSSLRELLLSAIAVSPRHGRSRFHHRLFQSSLRKFQVRVLGYSRIFSRNRTYRPKEKKVVLSSPGHFLPQQQTIDLMESDYLYPEIADRSSIEDWEIEGLLDIRQRARERAKTILASHYPSCIQEKVDRSLRERFPIHLSKTAMQP